MKNPFFVSMQFYLVKTPAIYYFFGSRYPIIAFAYADDDAV
jgi:hypothetical protein